MKFFILTLALVSANTSFAAEPSYCDPKTFYSKEVKLNLTKPLERAHLFKFGDVSLMGVAVGNSKIQRLLDFATQNTTAADSENYCTWYLNKGDSAAEENFNHFYLQNPKSLKVTTGPALYREILKDQFAKDRPNFLTCLQDHKYLAMGCNGQRHRGPTVFGMLLAFSGCSPTNAATIVNTVWGLNGVKPEVRLAIINEGKKLGDEDPEARLRIQKIFGY